MRRFGVFSALALLGLMGLAGTIRAAKPEKIEPPQDQRRQTRMRERNTNGPGYNPRQAPKVGNQPYKSAYSRFLHKPEEIGERKKEPEPGKRLTKDKTPAQKRIEDAIGKNQDYQQGSAPTRGRIGTSTLRVTGHITTFLNKSQFFGEGRDKSRPTNGPPTPGASGY